MTFFSVYGICLMNTADSQPVHEYKFPEEN